MDIISMTSGRGRGGCRGPRVRLSMGLTIVGT